MKWFSLSLNTPCSEVYFSNINIVTPAFFWLVLAWCNFLYHFTFHLFVSFYLKYISCKQHIVGSCFYSQSNDLWFLIMVVSHLYLMWWLIWLHLSPSLSFCSLLSICSICSLFFFSGCFWIKYFYDSILFLSLTNEPQHCNFSGCFTAYNIHL